MNRSAAFAGTQPQSAGRSAQGFAPARARLFALALFAAAIATLPALSRERLAQWATATEDATPGLDGAALAGSTHTVPAVPPLVYRAAVPDLFNAIAGAKQ